MKYTLTDGDARHDAGPHCFEMPSDAHREAIRRDDLVKLGFQPSPSGPSRTECLWVVVKSNIDGQYLGEMNHVPFQNWGEALKVGDTVKFEVKHILDIEMIPNDKRLN